MNIVLDFRLTPPESEVKYGTRIVFDKECSIADQLDAAESRLEETDVWLDFEGIESVNSEELSALVRFCLRRRRMETSVSVCNVGRMLGEIFEITRFGAWAIS